MARRFALAVMAVLVLSLLPHFHDHASGGNGAWGASCAFCLAGGSTAALIPPDAGWAVLPEFVDAPRSHLRDAIEVRTPQFLTSARPRDPPLQTS